MRSILKSLLICALISYVTYCSQARGQGGIITTVAGNGTEGFSGDGGPATSASLSVLGVAKDASGNLFIADLENLRIRKVSPDGIITTVAGNGAQGFSGDGGPAAAASLSDPERVAVDASGNLFIADSQNNNRIRKVSPNGIITTVAGNGRNDFCGDGGLATAACLNQPGGIAVDASGNLFIADSYNGRVRKVSPSGFITTVAGGGMPSDDLGDGGPATSASLSPADVAVDAFGNVFIADYITSRIRKVSPNGIITTVAGNGDYGFSGDGGPAASASLYFPTGVAVDASGNLFIADIYNSRIRKVSPNGVITTVAGNGDYGFSGDSGQATAASMFEPSSVAVDSLGNLLIADSENNRVREVSGPCPASVNLSFSGQYLQYMVASFTAPSSSNPNSSTPLLDYANSCGFASFNWQNVITHAPGGGGPTPEDPLPLIESGNVVHLNGLGLNSVVSPTDGICLSPTSWSGCSLVAPPSFLDPPQGGYVPRQGLGLGTFNPWPFFYPAYPSHWFQNGAKCTVQSAGCPPFPFVVSLDGATLSFVDDPRQRNLSGETPSTSPTGNFLAFQTTLVGIDNQGNPYPLYSWTWNSTYNGQAGGVTITSMNGAPVPAPGITQNGSMRLEH